MSGIDPFDDVARPTTVHVTAKGMRIEFLRDSRPKLIDYLKMKLDAEDWHGCQDAASDLRDLDSELDGLTY